jgi:hypothetical protein
VTTLLPVFWTASHSMSFFTKDPVFTIALFICNRWTLFKGLTFEGSSIVMTNMVTLNYRWLLINFVYSFLNQFDLLRLILFESWIKDWLISTTLATVLLERSWILFRRLFHEVPFSSEYIRLRILSIAINLDSWLIYLEFLTSWRSECGSHWLLLWDLSLLWNLFTKLLCHFRSGRLLRVYSSRSTTGYSPSAKFKTRWSTFLNTSWLCFRRLSWWGAGLFIAWNETGTNLFDDGEVLGALGIVCLEYRSQIDRWRVLLLHEPLTQFFRWFVCTNCFKWLW